MFVFLEWGEAGSHKFSRDLIASHFVLRVCVVLLFVLFSRIILIPFFLYLLLCFKIAWMWDFGKGGVGERQLRWLQGSPEGLAADLEGKMCVIKRKWIMKCDSKLGTKCRALAMDCPANNPAKPLPVLQSLFCPYHAPEFKLELIRFLFLYNGTKGQPWFPLGNLHFLPQ